MKNRKYQEQRRKGAGFTLLELMIAMVITGLISVLAYGGLQIGLSSWEKIIGRNDQITNSFLAQRFLRRILSTEPQAELINILHENSSVAFFCIENELIFLSSKSFTRKNERLWIYLTTSKTVDETTQLQMATLPYDSAQALEYDILISDLRNAEPHILLEGNFGDLEWLFLERKADGTQTWLSEWFFKSTLPVSIALSTQSDTSSQVVWPDLLIALDTNKLEIKNAL